MRSTVTQERAPKVPPDQLTLDRTLKHLRKLRWIGKDQEAQNTLQILNDTRLRPSLPGDRRNRDPSDGTALGPSLARLHRTTSNLDSDD
jgi:hypothetical protein